MSSRTPKLRPKFHTVNNLELYHLAHAPTKKVHYKTDAATLGKPTQCETAKKTEQGKRPEQPANG